MDILAKIMNIYKYLAIFDCIHTHTNTYRGTHTNIFWLAEVQTSVNISLVPLNINGINKQANKQKKNHKYSNTYHSMIFDMVGLFNTDKSY